VEPYQLVFSSIFPLYPVLRGYEFLIQDSSLMKEYYAKHVEKTMIKCITGLHAASSEWERRNHKKCGNIINVFGQVSFDTKHRVTRDQARSLLGRLILDSSFTKLRNVENALQRLSEMQEYFAPAKW